MENKKYHVAVLGATGAVGQRMIETLERRNFPVGELTLLSSARSAGKVVHAFGRDHVVQEVTPDSFNGVEIALFSAGGDISKKYAEEAVKRGAIVVDNTSAFRMDPNVPLVVPEVNEKDLFTHNGIIANPNCSTIQMVVALEPIRQAYGLSKVVVSTYQAVSGSGAMAIEELKVQNHALHEGTEVEANILPCKSDNKHYQIAYNAIPQIDKFTPNGFTFEEMKMINETRKIMHMPDLKVAATCVRIPVDITHSESVYIEVEKPGVSSEEVKELLKDSEGIILQDDTSAQLYPMPLTATGELEVFVGRIRKDLDEDKGFHMWVVSDNLLKGAAWNSVQIAERLISLGIV